MRKTPKVGNLDWSKMKGNILEMGKILAEEVQEYIRDYCPGSALGRISFIGYSLGGLITRAALPHLFAF